MTHGFAGGLTHIDDEGQQSVTTKSFQNSLSHSECITMYSYLNLSHDHFLLSCGRALTFRIGRGQDEYPANPVI
jgi:hypothetical protein